MDELVGVVTSGRRALAYLRVAEVSEVRVVELDVAKPPRSEVGDLLVIECAGAYGFVMASRYNAKPMPAELLVRDGEAFLVRERETHDDLMRGERIP